MTIDFDFLNSIVRAKFDGLRLRVGQEVAGVIVREEFFCSDDFLFRGYISFSFIAGDELLVVSVDCKRKSKKLFLESDLSEADGSIRIDGQRFEIEYEDAMLGSKLIMEWVTSFEAFIKESEVETIKHLKKALTSC